MPSPAALKYKTAADPIQTLRRAATDKRLRPMLHDEIQVFYHAALAAYVAAWNAYIKNLIIDFYDVIADPSDPKFRAIYTIARKRAENALTRFIVDPKNKFTFSEIYVSVYDYGIFN
ncbi:hypothetical protein J4G08_03605, partial [Candidatus Poribacteria bacterium]|nr:hypothetical protein [Candidatus Poribacteria bacterium]